MSLATLGAVAATGNDLPLPDTSALSVGECLILAGGGGTIEAVVIRSIARGRNIGVTVNRGALGTLPLAHTAPTTVSTYDPSGGGGGGGVTVRWVDLGIVTAASVVSGGRRVLYTTTDGEFVSALRFGDSVTLLDTNTELIVDIAAWRGSGLPYGALSQASINDGMAGAIFDRSSFSGGTLTPTHASPPLLAGELTATLSIFGASYVGVTPGWQANHVYADDIAITAAGRMWDLGGASGGTSGGSTPDFAGHFGGSVVDGDIEWFDEVAVPTVGAAHVYIEVATPVAP